MPSIELSARIGAMIVKAATAKGVEPGELQRTTGFDAAQAADPDARISLELETRLWDEAARLTGDEDFGLHAAEQLQPSTFDVIDYVIRTAPTMRAALQRLARYNRLVHDVAVFTLHDVAATTRIEHSFRDGSAVPCRHASEFTLASHVVVGSQMTATHLQPLAVEFQHAQPRSVAEHRRIFGVTPSFGAAMNALSWERTMLERPVPAADPALSSVVERHAAALLAARPVLAATHADRVRQDITRLLGAEEISLEVMATRLKMSPRSLQRKLAQDGATFHSLLDGVRHQLALQYLASSKIALSEVAYLLGYSEPSAFHRAFRRWTGATPSEMRERLSRSRS